MWANMMSWGDAWGGGFMFGPWHLLWWALLIVGIVAIVRWLLAGRREGDGMGDGSRALAILKERYARGEIDKAEFDAKRRDLA